MACLVLKSSKWAELWAKLDIPSLNKVQVFLCVQVYRKSNHGGHISENVLTRVFIMKNVKSCIYVAFLGAGATQSVPHCLAVQQLCILLFQVADEKLFRVVFSKNAVTHTCEDYSF